MKILVVAALVILSFVVVSYLLAAEYNQTNTATGNYTSISMNSKLFRITLVATNQSERERGLMNRSITNTTIMLFVFSSTDYQPFWMYNTYSNLDIMWLNVTGNAGRVVYIVRNATSCFDRSQCVIYEPNATANYVVEAKAGFSEANNVSVGTRVMLYLSSG